MAHIVKNLSLTPDKNYSEYIDFTVIAKDRLASNEDVELIFNNIPEGYEEWIKKNPFTQGFGITSDC
jgi:hypothetical protein